MAIQEASTIAARNILFRCTVMSSVFSFSPVEFVIGTRPMKEQRVSKFSNRLMSLISVNMIITVEVPIPGTLRNKV